MVHAHCLSLEEYVDSQCLWVMQEKVWVLGRAVCQLARFMEISVPTTPVASFIATTIASLPQLAAIRVCCYTLQHAC